MTLGRRVRIGVLGGTFDPIHHVHLLMARAATRALGLDTVLFVPAGLPSHRGAAVVGPIADRCAMVGLALAGERRCALSTVDAERPGPTYTIDTVAQLRVALGDSAELYLIIGADNLANVTQWHRSPELLSHVHVVALSRLGYSLVDPGLPQGQVTLVPTPCLDISGTMIRTRIAAGRSVRHLTPDAVADYIAARGLYLDTESSPATSPPPLSPQLAPPGRRLLVEAGV